MVRLRLLFEGVGVGDDEAADVWRAVVILLMGTGVDCEDGKEENEPICGCFKAVKYGVGRTTFFALLGRGSGVIKLVCGSVANGLLSVCDPGGAWELRFRMGLKSDLLLGVWGSLFIEPSVLGGEIFDGEISDTVAKSSFKLLLISTMFRRCFLNSGEISRDLNPLARLPLSLGVAEKTCRFLFGRTLAPGGVASLPAELRGVSTSCLPISPLSNLAIHILSSWLPPLSIARAASAKSCSSSNDKASVNSRSQWTLDTRGCRGVKKVQSVCFSKPPPIISKTSG